MRVCLAVLIASVELYLCCAYSGRLVMSITGRRRCVYASTAVLWYMSCVLCCTVQSPGDHRLKSDCSSRHVRRYAVVWLAVLLETHRYVVAQNTYSERPAGTTTHSPRALHVYAYSMLHGDERRLNCVTDTYLHSRRPYDAV
jgi:hypothetical protein